MHELDLTLSALADPTRRAIVTRLAYGEAGVMELAEPFDMSQPAISKHLKVLETAGLITRGRHGTKRPCRLNIAALNAIDLWFGMVRETFEANYNRLDDVLASLPPQKDRP